MLLSVALGLWHWAVAEKTESQSCHCTWCDKGFQWGKVEAEAVTRNESVLEAIELLLCPRTADQSRTQI